MRVADLQHEDLRQQRPESEHVDFLRVALLLEKLRRLGVEYIEMCFESFELDTMCAYNIMASF